MDNMDSLQKLINKKAKNRAEAEVSTFLDSMKKNRNLLAAFKDVKIITKKEGTLVTSTSMAVAFNSIYTATCNMLIDKLTEKYIDEESKTFIDNVERLSKEIEDLKYYGNG